MGEENLKQSLFSTGLDLIKGSLEANELEKSGEITEEELLDNLLESPLNATFWDYFSLLFFVIRRSNMNAEWPKERNFDIQQVLFKIDIEGSISKLIRGYKM